MKGKERKQERRKKAPTNRVMGKNCILELLQHAPERLQRVFTAKQDEDLILQKISDLGIPISFVSKEALNQLVQSESHQSFVAEVTPRSYLDLRSYLKMDSPETPSLLLLLDSILDPQNFGAILRTAECFGVDAVIWSKNRGVELTPVVIKVSMGASEMVPLIPVSNLVDAIRQLQKQEYFVYAAELKEHSEDLYHFTFPEKAAIVLGSEGTGVRPLVSKTVDGSLVIPMEGKIDSLNVSQAAAVLLSHWRSQRRL